MTALLGLLIGTAIYWIFNMNKVDKARKQRNIDEQL
tara:strand:+ start:749 stop:856 length:108 start_codon:yes stop_codon:yes gene_type:complete